MKITTKLVLSYQNIYFKLSFYRNYWKITVMFHPKPNRNFYSG